ncbi:hypothetical protein CTI12_AA347810 [Artemisia annua]|uniref:Uncharacterized protein n=1 Tax=Artemisia annua TaxID=35608 RepID=A0A2U1MM23_ARTAN|nr:hypothetical protein CTI12_AA347810 [Artemisia annua]
MKSSSQYSLKKSTIPPRRGQIKRRIIGQLFNSVANIISIKKKNRNDRNEVDGFSSGCNSSPLSPYDSGLVSDANDDDSAGT